MPSVHWRFALICLLLVPFLRVPVVAAPLQPPGAGPAEIGGAGVPMHQRFLESGASVVTTPEGRFCVASRRIAIETSEYRDPDGTAVAFAEILRSPASSVQAVAGPEEAGREEAPGFRVQLKYYVAPDTPLILMLGGRIVDARPLLEPSGDSLWIAGGPSADLAADLARAFAAGDPVAVVARSQDTGRAVRDTLPAPDLAALADCRLQLSAPRSEVPSGPAAEWPSEDGSAAEAVPPTDLPSSAIGIVFAAEPGPETLATPEDFAACGMKDPGLPLHLGRIRATTGFFAQTDKVFVAFDEAGAPAQVYVPGVFDAGFDGFEGSARVSRAADGNVPGAENRVAGCLGAAGTGLCRYVDADGSHRLGPCLSDFLPASGELFDPAPPPAPAPTWAGWPARVPDPARAAARAPRGFPLALALPGGGGGGNGGGKSGGGGGGGGGGTPGGGGPGDGGPGDGNPGGGNPGGGDPGGGDPGGGGPGDGGPGGGDPGGGNPGGGGEVPAIPLPAPALLLVAALAGLAGLRRRARA
jgi:hypothetical protein